MQRKNDIKQYMNFVQDQRRDLLRASRDQIIDSLSEYRDYRYAKGCSDSTVKKNISIISHILGVPADEKSERLGFIVKVGQPTKGRDNAKRVVNDYNREIIALNNCIGVRKEEILDLKGKDIIERDGNLYVVVRRGKGGKYQEQLVLKTHEEFVKKFFEEVDDESYIFPYEARNKCEHANLHACRRQLAQDCYNYYESLLKDPMEREKMMDLLEERFNNNPDKRHRFNRAKMNESYVTRGAVKQELYEAGRPLVYDRLALMATSVLHLAHYREDVTVKNYMK